MPTFNILTIDGGGLRGIIPIRILQKVEELTGKKIHETFDMMAGTSTGGLIVSCLTLPSPKFTGEPLYSLQDIAELYISKGKIIFPVQSGISRFFHGFTNLLRPAYRATGIATVLKEFVKEQRLSDAIRPILVSTYDLTSNRPVFFKTSEATGDELANARIADICRATSAAPTYLPAYSFRYKSKVLTGIDGGVYVNNPTMAALAEISRYGKAGFYKKKDGSPVAFEDIRILSLGTGTYTGTVTSEQAVRWGQLAWIQRITDIMMRGVNQTTDYETSEMLDATNYLRLNVAIRDPDYSDMADARDKTREYLEWETMYQVTVNQEKLGLLEQFLRTLS